MEDQIVCPDCGSIGQVMGYWEKPGMASGNFVIGLDVQNCKGCRDAMGERGYTPVVIGWTGPNAGTITPLTVEEN
ncbi:hypothetical protein [Sinomonas sp. P47F7]|uniref:hypothetical protein n=1 Tax=Sinomonas sp. P47F7 TaxID=3410987 RepID=UPI003BF4ACB8